MRILLIAPSTEILGGQSVQAQRLLQGFRETPSAQVDFLPINPPLPAWIRRLRYFRGMCGGLLYYPALLWKVPQYEILHIFTASYRSYTLWSLPALLLGRLLGKKVILNYRDGQVEDHLTRYSSAIPTIRLADRLIAPSDYVVEVFRQFKLPAQRIYNVLALDRFPFRRRQPLRPRFLSSRILEPLYNIDCILRAYQILQERFPDASLTIAHDGPSRPHLERLARDLQLRNCQFVGRIPHSQMGDLYDQADIYLTTPDWDCMPGSLLECFASGLPVIATRAGGIPYIVEHERTGLLIDRNDHVALAQAATRLLEDGSFAQQIIENARAECQKYRWDVVREQWLDVYRGLANDRATSSDVANPQPEP
jgi:glycosyltransferase involved in cell wall biosynthesis